MYLNYMYNHKINLRYYIHVLKYKKKYKYTNIFWWKKKKNVTST